MRFVHKNEIEKVFGFQDWVLSCVPHQVFKGVGAFQGLNQFARMTACLLEKVIGNLSCLFRIQLKIIHQSCVLTFIHQCLSKYLDNVVCGEKPKAQPLKKTWD